MKIFKKITTAFLAMVLTIAMSITAVNADTEAGSPVLIWNRPVKSSAFYVQAPVYYDGYVYTLGGKILTKIDAETGEVAATAEIGAGCKNSILAPAVGDGKLYIGIDGSANSNPALAIVDADSLEYKLVEYSQEGNGFQSISRIVYDADSRAVYLGSTSRVNGGTFVKVDIPADSEEEPVVTTLAETETSFYWAGACVTEDYAVWGSRSDGTDEAWTPAEGDAVVYVYAAGCTDAEGNPLVATTTLEGSGSICSSPVEYNGKFLVAGKGGKLYEVAVADEDGALTVSNRKVADLSDVTTCTPVIKDGKAYIGTFTGIDVINLSDYSRVKTIKTPGDVKMINTCGDRMLATYNKNPGGLYDVLAEKECFVPPASLQQYCISSISFNESGNVAFYTNDSKNIIAVRWFGESDVADLLEQISKQASLIVSIQDEYEQQLADKDAKIEELEAKVAAQEITINTYKAKERKTTLGTLSTKSGAITVKWSKTAGASGYRISYTKAGSSAKTVTVSGQTTVTKKITGLSKGKKYTIKIQPYTKVDGKTVYGVYSAGKTITVK